jgi:hypothetical protein
VIPWPRVSYLDPRGLDEQGSPCGPACAVIHCLAPGPPGEAVSGPFHGRSECALQSPRNATLSWRVRLSPARGRIAGVIVAVTSVAAGLFHMYSAGVSPFTALVQRPVHLALMSVLGFLGVGVQKIAQQDGEDSALTRFGAKLGWLLAALSVARAPTWPSRTRSSWRGPEIRLRSISFSAPADRSRPRAGPAGDRLGPGRHLRARARLRRSRGRTCRAFSLTVDTR